MMEYTEFKKEMKEKALKIDVNLSDLQVEKFYKYLLELLEWNTRMNLTAITEENEVIVKHFMDSLTINKYIPKGAKLIDVGTGAGFPGIPIKIVRDDVSVVLLDSLNKRISFLNSVIENLGLDKINAVHGRAEELGRNKNYREKFDIVTSRAVANMSVLSEYLLPFAKIDGKCVVMKGAEIDKELRQAEKAISMLGAKVNCVDGFDLLNLGIRRNIVVLDKIKGIPKEYPRKAGTPAKNPIR